MGKKTIIIRVEVDEQMYEDAKDLCDFTHQDIVEMIAEQGVTGLKNYIGHMDNWVDEARG